MSKQSNREAFPTIASITDDIRNFFPEAKVSYAEENGKTIGKELKTEILTTNNGVNRCKEG